MFADPSRIRLQFDFPALDEHSSPFTFVDPLTVLVAHDPGDVLPVLETVDAHVRQGRYAAGYLAYEAATGIDADLRTRVSSRPPSSPPLAWFGLFTEPHAAEPLPPRDWSASAWRPAIGQDAYVDAVEAVRQAIGQGDVYQANYSIRLRADFEGDPWTCYQQLRRAQGGAYAACLDLGRWQILSLSPELFFRQVADLIETRPMKGTRPRGRWVDEDRFLQTQLSASEKDRAENVMIVDLMRNDLGRVARIGSVQVQSLFDVEAYGTVWQMVSTVDARARPGAGWLDTLRALFPSGSITGAPKIAAMQTIASLETSPRGIYCGAIGIVTPHQQAVFNVAIRTLVIDSTTNVAEYGSGGGITWDSRAAAEYDEVLAKARVLDERWPEFQLIETFRQQDGGYVRLAKHLARLRASADYFGVSPDWAGVERLLDRHAREHAGKTRRVRLTVDRGGRPELSSDECSRPESSMEMVLPTPKRIRLAVKSVSTDDRFLFHKTTHRTMYDERAGGDVFAVLQWNECGELTEFNFGNLVVEIDGHRWTPPIDCGLLPGVYRAELLERGAISEKRLTREDLAHATRIWLVNSLREEVEVRLVD